MSKRQQILANAIFDTGGTIDGVKFGPLSPPVVTLLKRRGNVLVIESKRDQSPDEALGEILFVLSRTKGQRSDLFRTPADEWQEAVDEFVVGLGDKTLHKFGSDYLAPAMEAMRFAAVESEGPGKDRTPPTRATSRSSSKARKGSGSTRSRKH